MRGRETIKSSAPSADLLVCLPSRGKLALRLKSICSPGVLPDTGNCRRLEQRPHLKRSVTRGGQGSPLFWAKPKQMGSEIAEPTSPKVTCSGQIKVRAGPRPCKSWQSVMEDIERVHRSRKNKRSTWFEPLGVFKKDVVQFLTCLRSVRCDLRCFGTSPVDDTDDEDGDEVYHGGAGEAITHEGTSRTIFSKWFMVLQENQNHDFYRKNRVDGGMSCHDAASVAPPPNALLLMRCRSAPVKRWPVSGGNTAERNRDSIEGRQSADRTITEGRRSGKLGLLMNEEDEERKKMEAGDSLSSPDDTVTGRQIVSSARDPFSRSKSWKR